MCGKAQYLLMALLGLKKVAQKLHALTNSSRDGQKLEDQNAGKSSSLRNCYHVYELILNVIHIMNSMKLVISSNFIS